MVRTGALGVARRSSPERHRIRWWSIRGTGWLCRPGLALGTADDEGAIGFEPARPAVPMEHVVVVSAEQRAVVDGVRSAVLSLPEVVDLAPVKAPCAPSKAAPSISEDDGLADGTGDGRAVVPVREHVRAGGGDLPHRRVATERGGEGRGEVMVGERSC